MEKKKAIYIASIIFVICLASIFAITFAYIGKPTETGNANINVSIISNNVVTFSYTSTTTLNLTMALSNLAMANASNSYTSYSDSALANITVGLTTNSTVFPGGLTCSYDIVYTPTVAYTQTPAATSAGLNELVLKGKIGSTDYFETNIAGSSPIILYTNSISTPSPTSLSYSSAASQVWNFTARFYNLNIDQSQALDQNPTGLISIQNVRCNSSVLSNFIANVAPKSGIDAVSNSPWILTSDRDGEWRYAGKNPDNYIQFNGELWRIIGVIPGMRYCTGTYGTNTECNSTKVASLVKIINNETLYANTTSTFSWDYKKTGVGSSISDYGSNDWADSQLMYMLNGYYYMSTGYNANISKIHTGYAILQGHIKDQNGHTFFATDNNYLTNNGTSLTIPTAATTSSYTATNKTFYDQISNSDVAKIATVKWDLYGTNSYTTASEGSPYAFYNKEKNIQGIGEVYTNESLPENRPVYWYGKIALMSPSDYGYATNGNNAESGTYSRTGCLAYQMSGWSSGSYRTYCAGNSWLLYQGITSTAPGSSGTSQWTLNPHTIDSTSVFNILSVGSLQGMSSAISPIAVRPTLYLKADTEITGGTGKWNDPYTIS